MKLNNSTKYIGYKGLKVLKHQIGNLISLLMNRTKYGISMLFVRYVQQYEEGLFPDQEILIMEIVEYEFSDFLILGLERQYFAHGLANDNSGFTVGVIAEEGRVGFSSFLNLLRMLSSLTFKLLGSGPLSSRKLPGVARVECS